MSFHDLSEPLADSALLNELADEAGVSRVEASRFMAAIARRRLTHMTEMLRIATTADDQEKTLAQRMIRKTGGLVK